MELEYHYKEKLVGAFMIGIFLLLFTTLIVIGRGKDWFANYVTFYTVFNESYNLQENAAIKLYKADIGKVQYITLIENQVRVKLLILERYRSRIREDSIAVVESPTLIGSEYISILPGNPDSRLLKEGGELKSKAKRSIADFISEFQVEKTAKMLVQATQDISVILEKIKDPSGPIWAILENLKVLTAHFNAMAEEIQKGDGGVSRLLFSDDMTGSIGDSIQRVNVILKSLESALKSAPETTENIHTVLKQINHITKDVDISVRTIQRILKNFEAGSQNIPAITQTATQGIKEIREGVENIDRVVKSLQKSILIRPNLDPEPQGENADAGLRQ